MKEKCVVTISRYWNNPKIITEVTGEKIALSMEMGDFLKAVKNEIGSVATVITKQEFSTRLDKAVETVLEKVKEESVKAVY